MLVRAELQDRLWGLSEVRQPSRRGGGSPGTSEASHAQGPKGIKVKRTSEVSPSGHLLPSESQSSVYKPAALKLVLNRPCRDHDPLHFGLQHKGLHQRPLAHWGEVSRAREGLRGVS